ncbi:MAG: hypothetical protein B6A08_13205 [Sorangiineae bacterium NIC37A_2]|nr:MAG: hypothetical protein B6A08_13205 [Sorangiineae bacterium NIC37A_2]
MTRPSFSGRVLLPWTLGLALVACEKKQEPSDARPQTQAIRVDPPAPPKSPPAPAPPQNPPAQNPAPLLVLPESAYSARLAFDGEKLVLTTPLGVHILDAQGKVESRAAAFGHLARFDRGRIVFHRDGAFWSQALMPKRADKRLAPTKADPSLMSLKGTELAWVEPEAEAGQALFALGRTAPHLVYRSPGTISALHIEGDHAFFVEQSREGAWRIGRASLDKSAVVWTEPRRSRPPAMLTGSERALYYYEGLEGGVHELAFDFSADRVLVRDFICSPLAAAVDLFCASVTGVQRVPLDEAPPIPLATAQDGPIPFIVARATEIAWVSDVGPEKLAVRRLSLAAP